MDSETTQKIKAFATDKLKQNAFNALLDYYNLNSLYNVTEEMGLEFLAKLESGEIVIPNSDDFF